MFERPESGERALLIHIDFGQESDREDLQEFKDLVASAGVETLAVVTGARTVPEPKYLIGRGKADEVREALLATGAELVLVNHALAPRQERNLERLLECRVLDRTSLILDIFAQRAQSAEGKIQVELAQLRHLSTRLVRGWTHLERQKGGIGLRGPGETQLETDRRLLGDRIKTLLRRLERVRKQREQGRKARLKAEVPTVALVGYTNAGKSTLFNRLTNEAVYTADKLFATLDPTLRQLALTENEHAVLADTVGFIRHLPHDLVAAFRSTLQETVEATLLLHVVDVSSADRHACMEQVHSVLEEIGADKVPTVEVYNKLDQTPHLEPRVERDQQGRIERVWVSALSGAGVDQLIAAIAEVLREELVHATICLPADAGRLRAQLYQNGRVLAEQVTEDGRIQVTIEMPKRRYDALNVAAFAEVLIEPAVGGLPLS